MFLLCFVFCHTTHQIKICKWINFEEVAGQNERCVVIRHFSLFFVLLRCWHSAVFYFLKSFHWKYLWSPPGLVSSSLGWLLLRLFDCAERETCVGLGGVWLNEIRDDLGRRLTIGGWLMPRLRALFSGGESMMVAVDGGDVPKAPTGPALHARSVRSGDVRYHWEEPIEPRPYSDDPRRLAESRVWLGLTNDGE